MTAPPTVARLTRDGLIAQGLARSAPPVRIVHLGVGAFHRAHQAWYTARAADASAWGIAAFTGRSPAVADALSAQGGVFTLVERGADGDSFAFIDSISSAHASADRAAMRRLVAAERTAVVTLTITEAGYHFDAAGRVDPRDPEVAADLSVLRADDPAPLRTPLARLVDALRWRGAQAGPIAVVPCDNLPSNGSLLGRAVADLAAACGWDATHWPVSFVSTSVDRITPHTTDADTQAVEAATGFRDDAAVVAEPFADWVLAGEFPAGRPDWAGAGARVVTDIAPFERRKLLMLNGGHLALAFSGLLRGRRTVAEAMADPECRSVLDRFWDEAEHAVGAGAETPHYRRDLVARFGNDRIAHRLAQIAVDTPTKVRLRILPVITHALAHGRATPGALRVVQDWGDGVRRGAVAACDDDSTLLRSVTATAPATTAAAVRSAFEPRSR